MQVLRRGSQVGPYTILGAVPGGVGGMATVYKARLGQRGSPVALKVAHEGLGSFLKDEGAFLKARELEHPHIVKILPTPLADGTSDYIVKDPISGSWYFAMEYLDGGDLDQWLRRRKRLSLPEAVQILEQVGSALDTAHTSGIVHLDVKPSNILFRTDPRRDKDVDVVLTDFGIARPEGRIASGQTMTVEYASPEQVQLAQGGLATVSAASDLYSLAVIFYEMLTGRLPFEAANDTAMAHHIIYEHPDWTHLTPDGLVPLLQRALSKDPSARYPTAGALVADLRGVASVRSGDVGRLSPVSAPSRVGASQLHPLMTLFLGIVIGLGLGGAAGFHLGSGNGEPPLLPSPTVQEPQEATTVPTPSISPTPLPERMTPETITSESGSGDVPLDTIATPPLDVLEEPTRRPTSTSLPPTPTWTPRPPATPTPIAESDLEVPGQEESMPSVIEPRR